jgi:prepilin-type N-terminal cleavage/methylation domain-containing protein
MRTLYPRYGDARSGFSLLEMIGVLAIMAILAGALAPGALRSIERAAVRAEASTLAALGEQIEFYAHENGAPPSTTEWTTRLAALGNLAPADIATNRRGVPRVYILDPATSPARRVLVLSGMRPDLALPAASAINTPARFDDLWNTPDGTVPSTASWSGWSAWNNVPDGGEKLVVGRIGLATATRSFTVTLNNAGPSGVAYVLVDQTGAASATSIVDPGVAAVLSGLKPRSRLDLYRTTGSSGSPDYSYVVSDSGRTFEFDGTQWISR